MGRCLKQGALSIAIKRSQSVGYFIVHNLLSLFAVLTQRDRREGAICPQFITVGLGSTF
jgi:hypothetical protein